MKFLIPSLLLAFANNVANAEGDHTPMNQLLQEQLESLVPKIVDGVEVNPKFKYPYMVYAGGCGASLVAPNVLLSAAHCFNAINSVKIGRHNLLDNSENYESFSIVEKVRHPNYDSGTLDYDFMMLRMSGSSSRTPVVLDDGSVSLDAGRDVIPIGWGTTSSGGATSNVLLEVEVDLYSKAQCQSAYGASSITDRMVCAARPGKDICQGDSGGPMIDKVSGKQVGVVSWDLVARFLSILACTQKFKIRLIGLNNTLICGVMDPVLPRVVRLVRLLMANVLIMTGGRTNMETIVLGTRPTTL